MEQQFLYGHHVLKSGLGRITENTPKYQGVVVLSMADVPLVSTFYIINCSINSRNLNSLKAAYVLLSYRGLVRQPNQHQNASTLIL